MSSPLDDKATAPVAESELARLRAELETQIRERRQVEAALRESEASYARVVAGMERASVELGLRQTAAERAQRHHEELIATVEGIVWEADASTFVFTFVSAQAERLLGYPVRAWLESPTFWADHIHPDDRTRVVNYCVASTRDGRDHDFDYRMVAADGRTVWLHDVVTVVVENDRPTTLRGIMVDITAAKQGEAERQALEAQVGQAQKMEAVGRLAGGIAHDFNNILGVILGNLTLAQNDIGPDHLAAESLEQIHGGVCRAAALVQQILAFSRPQSLEKRVMKLRASIEEDARLLRTTIPQGVELITHFYGDAPDIVSHPNAVHQVLVNLCTNAWHAMEGGAGRITMVLDEVIVSAGSTGVPGVLRPGRYARLTVTDTGKGMDAETLARIFEPFFTTKEVGKGTGLGLAIVHGIMTNLGGAITAVSEQDRGTTFELFFPAATAEHQTEPADAASPSVPRGRGQHILFLDDEQALVNLGAKILERHGFRVTPLTSAAEALSAIQGNPGAFDLVITDYHMPHVSGIHLAMDIGALRPDLPVMLASGLVTDALAAEAAAAGVRHLLDKPYSARDLCTLVHRALQPPGSSTR